MCTAPAGEAKEYVHEILTTDFFWGVFLYHYSGKQSNKMNISRNK